MSRSSMPRLVPATLLILLSGPGSALGQEAPLGSHERRLDLQSVVERALQHNAGFLAIEERRSEVAGGVDEAGADAWPQVELTSSWSLSRNPSLLNSPDFEDIVGQFPNFQPGEEELWGLFVEVEQPLYTGGKVTAAVELAELAVDITEAQISLEKLNLGLESAEAFYDLLLARDAVTTLETQQKSRRGALEVVESRYEIGEATELERLRAQASLAELAPVIANAEGEVLVAESRLRALLGFDVDSTLLVRAPERREVKAAPSFESLWALAISTRPDLVDLELQGQALARQEEVTVAEGRPQLELKGAYGRRVRLIEDLTDDLFADWRVSIGFSWNLFDGGRRRGQVAQLESRRRQNSLRFEELRRQVRGELQRGLADHKTGRARYSAAVLAAAAASEASRVAAENYSLGVALQADQLDADDQAVRQQLAVDQAFYESLKADARLRRLAGLLPNEEFNLDRRPSELRSDREQEGDGR